MEKGKGWENEKKRNKIEGVRETMKGG